MTDLNDELRWLCWSPERMTTRLADLIGAVVAGWQNALSQPYDTERRAMVLGALSAAEVLTGTEKLTLPDLDFPALTTQSAHRTQRRVNNLHALLYDYCTQDPPPRYGDRVFVAGLGGARVAAMCAAWDGTSDPREPVLHPYLAVRVGAGRGSLSMVPLGAVKVLEPHELVAAIEQAGAAEARSPDDEGSAGGG